ncbi:hypothetical protein F4X88_19165 [Candidatus Poribacteria bacterium]|nr:hypothetical protein [Candidatus Poribacteria bacterium]MYA58403.1 hypothetical protein [Candidatus Poribacteria bacterium]
MHEKCQVVKKTPWTHTRGRFFLPKRKHWDSKTGYSVEIDTTAFKEGGTLTIDLWIGGAEGAGAFILFTNDNELSTDGMPKVVLTSASGIIPGKGGRITHRFEEGTRFKLGATGNSFSGEGKVNSFLATISIEAAL